MWPLKKNKEQISCLEAVLVVIENWVLYYLSCFLAYMFNFFSQKLLDVYFGVDHQRLTFFRSYISEINLYQFCSNSSIDQTLMVVNHFLNPRNVYMD